MAGKKITELTQANAVADSDLFIVETANGTQSVPYSSFKSEDVSFNGTGANSIALGINAQANSSDSIAIGNAKVNTSNAYNSIAIGNDYTVASKKSSIAIGDGSSVYGNFSVGLGCIANAWGNYSLSLGTESFSSGNSSTALGHLASTSNSNSIQLGDAANLSSITAKVPITTTSDERDKTDIAEIKDSALEFLNKVKAIRYVFNGRKLYIDNENLSDEEREKLNTYGMCDYDKEAHAQGTKKGSRMRVGVSAQNIQQALIDVFGDSGYANLVNDNLFDYNPDDIPDGVESQLAVNYEGFIPFLIKAVQELDARVKELENK